MKSKPQTSPIRDPAETINPSSSSSVTIVPFVELAPTLLLVKP